MEFFMEFKNDDYIVDIIKIFFICLGSFYLNVKIINESPKIKIKEVIILAISFILISILNKILKEAYGYIYSIIITILIIALIFKKMTQNNFTYSMLITTISISITYILLSISIFVDFLINTLINIKNTYINLVIIILTYIVLLYKFISIKRFKRGISFLKGKIKNEYLEVLILNISIVVLFSIIILSNYTRLITSQLGNALIIFAIIMFITIQKSLQLYYKQKLQQKELEETKEELEKAKKEITELEQENLNFSKKSHSIAHKQKSLEYKLNQLLLTNEIAEEIDIRDRIKEISKQIQNEDTTIELTKTNIEEIDDMLKYMQSECEKNKINFELQVNGNIHHMVNKFIAKENLEILLADHIKNAIIAINYSENINRSILVKLGLVDGLYSIYIYDTGIEFEIKTLQNLGQTPSTTHADNGGTGMGFMNTFDTLNKYKASIIINEYGKPSEDNYTKYIAIKFDNKNEYKISSYRSEEIEKQVKENSNMIIENV